jgi:hypothetical protein
MFVGIQLAKFDESAICLGHTWVTFWVGVPQQFFVQMPFLLKF